jgi:hypothetical protein
MEGQSHTIIKVHLFQSIGESENIIKIGHDAAPVFTHNFSSHIYLFYIYFVSFWALKPKRPHIFFYQSRPGPGGLRPWAQTQNLLRGPLPILGPNARGFCPLQYTFLNLGSFAHFWGQQQGAKPVGPNSKFYSGGFCPFWGPLNPILALNFGWG